MTSKKLFLYFKDYFVITIGLFLYVCGWVAFVFPKEIVGGGVSGIGALINYATGGANGGFPVAYTYFIVNIVLLLLAVKILGRGFGAKTVYAIFIATFFFSVVPHIIPQSFLTSFHEKNSELICAIIGGVFSGAGIGISFTRGGSTGGTDIIALMINKYRDISPGRVILYIDIFIIGSSYLLFHDIAKVIYGYVMIGITSYTVDMILSGSKQSVQIFIFSKHYEQIADRITRDCHRGVTAINAKGWFTKEDGTVLMILARKYEAPDIYRVIREEDKDAFISVATVMGVYGKGFEQFKKK
ncbi:MAG: YitT family protein [Prevotellaceae bacterium]|jgi:uncharacterized membrane-anchored protein YitT (DUF2179 family)|nr:YitT family protein [Prevotellaceae bacterium]